jgi:hypothetical protein
MPRVSLAAILEWIEYAYLLRFQIAAALMLAVGLPLAYYLVPSVFVGLFDAMGLGSFLFVVWAAFQVAWTIMVTSRLVLVYGPARFGPGITSTPKPVGAGTVALFGLLAVPVVVVLFRGTEVPTGGLKVLAAVLGLVLAVGVLALTASLHFAIEDPAGHTAETVLPSFDFLAKKAAPRSQFWSYIGSRLSRLPPTLIAGILDRTRLRSGHEMATIAVLLFLVLYGILGIVFSPAWSSPERQPAALFFVLLLLVIFTWLFAGAAFFLDRTRLPVFTTLLVLSIVAGLAGTDHKFVVKENANERAPLAPRDVIEAWAKRGRGQRSNTILIVATAGGGIRAAAWTAEVMTRLDEGCKAASNSLLLVSSVSGGSVGSMFVVGPYSGKGDYPSTAQDLAVIRYNAMRSSLGAVGWGLAYPDVARTVPILGSLLVPETMDRGWSLENAWSTAWRDAKLGTPTMAEWRKDVMSGMRPAVIFNATATESGERFLLASTDTSLVGAKRFFDLFPRGDIAVATAARLSATFPYVSPLARPSLGPASKAYHLGDGGYYDNSGLLSAVEWIREAGSALSGYRVLLVVIDSKAGPERPGSSWSWQKQMVGPIEMLLHVRTSSQQVRDSLELDMGSDYLAVQTPPVNVTPVRFLFSSPSPAPLSWHLTQQQKAEIAGSWAIGDNQKSWCALRTELACSCDAEILKAAQGDEN